MLFVAIGLLVVALAVAAVVFVPRLLRPGTPASPGPGQSATPTPVDQSPREGSAGLGDPYFPDFGSGGYDVSHYDINVSWDPDTQVLTGKTTFTAKTTQNLAGFYFDLLLPVQAVKVNGTAAKFSQRSGSQDVQVEAPVLPLGSEFSVTVDYAGKPEDYNKGREASWLVNGIERVVCGEPSGSVWWYPANDYPTDPASFDVKIRVPSGYQAISVGTLLSKDAGNEAAFDTWSYRMANTVPTYTVFMALGHYEIETGTANGRPFLYAVSKQFDATARKTYFENLRQTPQIVSQMEAYLGKYPLSDLGGVVPAVKFWFGALEDAGRPLYAANAATPEIIAHEYTHMWAGDTVTLRQWKDIFNNEAMASYSEWVWEEKKGGRAAAVTFAEYWQSVKNDPKFFSIKMSDPGKNEIFTTVYSKGPMAMHALRTIMGDDAFFKMWADWLGQSGPRSVDDFLAFAKSRTDKDLNPWFKAWLIDTVAPAPTPENGF